MNKSKNPAFKNSARRITSERGFSLLEVVISMMIFLIVTGALYGLMRVGLIDRNRSSRRSDIMKNARAAVYLIGRDVANAGLGFNRSGAQTPDNFISTRLGLPADADTKRDLLTGIIGGNNLFADILNADPNAKTDLISFAYRDMSFNGGNSINLASVSAPSGQPSTARIQSTTATGTASSAVYDLYLIESQTTQVAAMATTITGTNRIDFAVGDPLNLNQAYNGAGTNSSLLRVCASTIDTDCTTYSAASAKRFFWVSYRVQTDGTLIRTIYGNNTGSGAAQQVQVMPLAYNIEDFQIRYVLEDGTVTDNPAAGADNIAGTADDTPANFNFVRQVTVTLRVQATENDEQTGKPDTVTLISTFSTRNLEYDAG